MAVSFFHKQLAPCWALLILGSLCVPSLAAQVDKAAEARRTLLTHVRRVVIVPPFFAMEQPARPDGKSRQKIDQASLDLYLAQLRKLEARTKERLPERAAARTPFEIVPYHQLESALEDLLLTPEQLFQNNGRMRGSKFAVPDAEAVKKLCAVLKADAILLGTLDEPRRSNGRTVVDPCGIWYESPHVRSRAGYFVLMADGTEVIKPVVDVLRPLTRVGKRDYVFVDWTEAQDQIIENLMDEWTRYTPARIAENVGETQEAGTR